MTNARAFVLAWSLLPLLACKPTTAPHDTSTGQAQDSEAVIAAVDAMFDAMREHDVEALRARLVPGAVIVALHERDGEIEPPHFITDEDFIARTAGDSSMTIDERFTATPEVRSDGFIATLWGEYEVFVDGTRRHCGVDSVQLARDAGVWRVTAITYCARPCR